MASSAELSSHLPMQGYIVYRDSAPDLGFDPTAPLAFFPPKDSDELFDALRTKYPLVKTHSERMRDAIIEFLLEERAADLAPTISADFSPWQPSWPSMSSTATSSSVFSSPEIPELATPSFGNSPKPVPSTTRQASSSGSSAASCGNSPPQMDQMTGVFSVSARNQPRQHVRRKMTEVEKVEYRKRRIVKACDKCSKRKRKCHHNQPQMETLAEKHNKVSKSRGIAATKPIFDNAYTMLPGGDLMDGNDWSSLGGFDMGMPLYDDISSFIDDSLFDTSFEDENLFAGLTQDNYFQPSQPQHFSVHQRSAHNANAPSSATASPSMLLSQQSPGFDQSVALRTNGTLPHAIIHSGEGQLFGGLELGGCEHGVNANGQRHDRVSRNGPSHELTVNGNESPMDRISSKASMHESRATGNGQPHERISPEGVIHAGESGGPLYSTSDRTGDSGGAGGSVHQLTRNNLHEHGPESPTIGRSTRSIRSQSGQPPRSAGLEYWVPQTVAGSSSNTLSRMPVNVPSDQQNIFGEHKGGEQQSLTDARTASGFQNRPESPLDPQLPREPRLTAMAQAAEAQQTSRDCLRAQNGIMLEDIQSTSGKDLTQQLYIMRHRTVPRADAAASALLRSRRDGLSPAHRLAVNPIVATIQQYAGAGVTSTQPSLAQPLVAAQRGQLQAHDVRANAIAAADVQHGGQEGLNEHGRPCGDLDNVAHESRLSDHNRFRDHHGRASTTVIAGALLFCFLHLALTMSLLLPLVAMAIAFAADGRSAQTSTKKSAWSLSRGSSELSWFALQLRSSMPRLVAPICV